GDVTSELTVRAGKKGTAYLLAKEDLVVCGLPLIAGILSVLPGSPEFSVRGMAEEGAKVRKGAILGKLSSDMRSILAAERTILNFIQRLSGIATHASKVMRKARSITVIDSRKTTPGMRLLEKYAVRTGGGRNHRFSLSDMILVKNNHIDANGGDLRKT